MARRTISAVKRTLEDALNDGLQVHDRWIGCMPSSESEWLWFPMISTGDLACIIMQTEMFDCVHAWEIEAFFGIMEFEPDTLQIYG